MEADAGVGVGVRIGAGACACACVCADARAEPGDTLVTGEMSAPGEKGDDALECWLAGGGTG
jgi:hypothetical protein